MIQPNEQVTQIDYEIEVYGIIKIWLFFVSVVCCWLIFPPVLVYRALSTKPRQLMRKMLQAIE